MTTGQNALTFSQNRTASGFPACQMKNSPSAQYVPPSMLARKRRLVRDDGSCAYTKKPSAHVVNADSRQKNTSIVKSAMEIFQPGQRPSCDQSNPVAPGFFSPCLRYSGRTAGILVVICIQLNKMKTLVILIVRRRSSDRHPAAGDSGI